MKDTIEEEEDEIDESEEEEPEYEGIGREQLGDLDEEDDYEERPDEISSYELLRADVSSMVGGMQTPDIDIKKQTGSKVPLPSEPRPLYKILDEVKTAINANELYPTQVAYNLPKAEAEEADINI